jgi:hypothetical protein
MASHIDLLASDRARLRRMSQAGYSFATTQQWQDRALLMEQLYRRVLARRSAKLTSVAAWKRICAKDEKDVDRRGGGFQPVDRY